jgi:hypothetical protein
MPANIFVTGSGISWHRTLRRNHFTSCANGISGLNSMRTKILKIVVEASCHKLCNKRCI